MTFDDIYPETARPYVACFVILRRENKIAMVLRKNTGYMDGHYGLPSGKGEWFEASTQAAQREAKEEAGVDIKSSDLRFVHLAHRHAVDNASGKFMDWVDVYFEADSWNGEPYNAEEDKSERLDWIDIDNLPENIIPPVRNVLERVSRKEKYSEYGWK